MPAKVEAVSGFDVDHPNGTVRGMASLTDAKFWRLRATPDDDLHFEASADGETFTMMANSGPNALGSLAAVRVRIAFTSGSGSGEGSSVRLGGLRSP